jgi:hypothetical protein
MPARAEDIEAAASLMAGFAERTGLASDAPDRRYLWTDAFAVCNGLGLARATGEARWRELALRLVDRVHHVLGRHRPDDSRGGWLSGLDDAEGQSHPTRGGLRIGKELPERGPEEPPDPRLEWDRDGQYFHYLTRWMHALDQVARETRDPRFNLWARELAHAAHASFVYGPREPGRRRMFWKLSTDLSRPLVAAMGQHDPLDGLVTCLQLEATASLFPGAPGGPSLAPAIADFGAMLGEIELGTDDPLGLGALLFDARRASQLVAHGVLEARGLPERLLAEALRGVARCARRGDWQEPASRRLAFRELGLAIGLAAIEPMHEEARGATTGGEVLRGLEALEPYAPLGAQIACFWLDPAQRRPRSWAEHRDINEVMLAAALLPESYLGRLSDD